MTEITYRQHPSNPVEMSFLVPYYRARPIYAELNNLSTNNIAMVHPDVLALLYHLALNINGLVLELGPYVGGSTIALCWGLRDGKIDSEVITVEIGGKYDHPTHGTDDIVRDLRRNLDYYQVSSMVSLVVGNSRDPEIVRQVHGRAFTAGRKIGLFFIDTDGMIGEDFSRYGDLLEKGSYLVIDDYFAPGAPGKMKPIYEEISALEDSQVVECLGVYGWGTWVGRVQ